MQLRDSLDYLLTGQSLPIAHIAPLLDELCDPQVNQLQAAACLALLRAKPESLEEIIALVQVLQKRMMFIDDTRDVCDIVGTGGDNSNSINISTGSAIVAASCGVPVVKHGNRAVSSQCGAADVLEALGVKIEQSVEEIQTSLQKINIAFCFAPHFHPTLKALRPLRTALQLPTTFNLLGPLLNPLRPHYLIIGVAQARLQNLYAQCVQKLGVKRALIVHCQGMDELTCVADSAALFVTPIDITSLEIEPKKLGLTMCRKEDLQGGNPTFNAERLQAGLMHSDLACADTFALNAGTALWLMEKVENMAEGVAVAKEAIRNGSAMKVLEEWKLISNTPHPDDGARHQSEPGTTIRSQGER